MNRRAFLAVAGIFLAGALLGGVTTHVAEQSVLGENTRTRRGPSHVVEELTQQIGLTPEQQVQVTQILEETRKRYDEIYKPILPLVDQARQDGRARIRSVLTPEQLPKFEEYLRQLDERRKNAGKK
jgi:Spy/CpxP family protein refolding chaperone